MANWTDDLNIIGWFIRSSNKEPMNETEKTKV